MVRSKIRRAVISVFLGAVMLGITVFSGCGEPKQQEFTFMFWDDLENSTDLVARGYYDTIQRFNEQYAGTYHCNIEWAELEDYYDALDTRIAHEGAPDVFIVSPGANLDAYVERDITADISRYLHADADSWYRDFNPGVFDKVTYGDAVYALPLNLTAACVFYNRDLFERAGCDIPTDYDELVSVCERLRDAGITPIAMSLGTSWCNSMLAGYLCDREGGPNNLDAVISGTGDWSDPSFIEAGRKLAELSQYFQDTAATDDNNTASTLFATGGAAMLLQGSWMISFLGGTESPVQDSCGVFPFPAVGAGDPKRIVAKSDSLAMSRSTHCKDGVIAFMRMMTDDESQRYVVETGGRLPITGVAYDETSASPLLGDVIDMLSTTSGVAGFYNESLPSTDAGSYFDAQMVDIALGKITPEQAFDNMNQYFRQNFQDTGTH